MSLTELIRYVPMFEGAPKTTFSIANTSISINFSQKKINNVYPNKLKIVFIKNQTLLCSVDFKWIKDNSFHLDKINKTQFVFEKNSWFKKKNGGVFNREDYWHIKHDKWILYFDKTNLHAIGVGKEKYFNQVLKKLLTFGYLNTTLLSSRLMLHAASVLVNRHCFIFPSKSDGGKTTLSNNAIKSGLEVLSDECIVLSKEENKFIAHPTPFGDIGNFSIGQPLSAIILLRQSNQNKIDSFPKMNGFLSAWYEEFWYRRYFMHGEYEAKLLDQLKDLYNSVPCFSLEFKKDFQDWDILSKALNN